MTLYLVEEVPESRGGSRHIESSSDSVGCLSWKSQIRRADSVPLFPVHNAVHFESDWVWLKHRWEEILSNYNLNYSLEFPAPRCRSIRPVSLLLSRWLAESEERIGCRDDVAASSIIEDIGWGGSLFTNFITSMKIENKGQARSGPLSFPGKNTHTGRFHLKKVWK